MQIYFLLKFHLGWVWTIMGFGIVLAKWGSHNKIVLVSLKQYSTHERYILNLNNNKKLQNWVHFKFVAIWRLKWNMWDLNFQNT